jgi:hypothetical protein
VIPTPSDTEPAPTPTNATPVPTRNGEPIPAPGSTDSTNFQRPVSGQIQQVQHVSVEEFQRLPGVVISGPAQSSVPSMGTQPLVPPPLSTVSVPPQPINTVQQAQWVPVK